MSLATSAVLCACASAAPRPVPRAGARPDEGRLVVLRAKEDPTVYGVRLVPEYEHGPPATGDLAREPRARWVVEGRRFLSLAGGGVRSADERLGDVTSTLALPARLGGGFLFVQSDVVYRADDWLADARPIFRSSRHVLGVFAGLDRMYARTVVGTVLAHVAFDAKSGAVLDPGPFPIDPMVGEYVAIDGWHALALTDLGGVQGTADAGRTWDKLDVPFGPRSEILAVRQDDRARALDAWVTVTPDARAEAFVVTDGPRPVAGSSGAAAAPRCSLVTAALEVRALGSCDHVRTERVPAASGAPEEASRALAAAVADGWPLADGTALLIEHGDVWRVSLADGSVVDVGRDATDRRAHCHAVSLAGLARATAFGFVCGEPEGKTTLLAYDETVGRIRAVRVFDDPRLVQTSGNGAWLVHGPCGGRNAAGTDAQGTDAQGIDRQWTDARGSYCIGSPSGPAPSAPARTAAADAPAYAWREVKVTPASVAAVTVLADGRLVRVVTLGKAADARLLLTSPDGKTESRPLAMEEAFASKGRFLSRAVWLADLEEWTPGVLHGWLMGERTTVGILVRMDGTVRAGELVNDLVTPFVAGRYGLGGTRTRRGYETTDGGLTWLPFAAPTPLAPSRVRVCGPAGCLADGWVRVGWGERPWMPTPPVAAAPQPRDAPTPRLPLHCQVTERPRPRSTTPRLDALLRGTPPASSRSVGPDLRLVVDLHLAFEPSVRVGPLGSVAAWGPDPGPWAALGKWALRWRSPFDGDGGGSTATGPAPFYDADAARRLLGLGRVGGAAWSVTVASDNAHALVVSRTSGHAPELMALDAGAAPTTLRRIDGEPWPEVDAALRVGSEWFVAAFDDGRRSAVSIFRVDAAGARRIATVPRWLAGPTGGPVRLARRDPDGAVGVVFDGEPSADRSSARRWVVAVGIDTGRTAEPEALGAADLGDRAEVTLCDERGGSGWVVDEPWPNANVAVSFGEADAAASLEQIYARVRLWGDRACVERLTGTASSYALGEAQRGGPRRPPSLPTLTVGDDLRVPVLVVTQDLISASCGIARARP